MNTDHSRRSFLRTATLAATGAAISTAALSGAIGAPLAGNRSRTVSELARELSAALEAAGASWSVTVTAEGHQINFKPVTPWDEIVGKYDALASAADCHGWYLGAGRSGKAEPVRAVTHGIKRVLEPIRPGSAQLIEIDRLVDLGRVA